MPLTEQRMLAATLVLAVSALGQEAMGQAAPSVTREQAPLVQSPPSDFLSLENLPSRNQNPSLWLPAPEVSWSPQPLFDFKDSDIKFKLGSLMRVLRDSGHEGWVLAAYPDPKTSRPLIGAGFGLDVMAMEHIQRDPLNPHAFLEPSSAQLWQAAGLDEERLRSILERYDHDLKSWKKKNFRKKIKAHALPPGVTDEEATRLLRISAIQAVHNARAYCRHFDDLSGTQQMALSQLVFQMGVNLEEFVEFLGALNNDASHSDAAQPESNPTADEGGRWKMVQTTLIQSDWARRYTTRAVTVIAMFNPDYGEDPGKAERQVRDAIRPPARHHRKKPHTQSVRAGNGPAPGHQYGQN